MASFVPEWDSGAVRELAESFFATVVDLPASEDHHHSAPWGLLDHSLEVADFALTTASTERFVTSTAVYPEEQHYRLPRFRAAAWTFGLLHDVGKVMTVAVRSRNLSRWNPYDESLVEFYGRHRGDETVNEWRTGRGMHGHSFYNNYLTARIIPQTVLKFIGRSVLEVFVEQKDPAGITLAKIIREADTRSTAEDLDRKNKRVQTADGPEPISISARLVDYVPQVPATLARAVTRGDLRPNVDLYVGRKAVLLKYPETLERLGLLLRAEVGSVCINTRRLDGTELAARILANDLHLQRKLLYDRTTDTWKLKAQVQRPEGTCEVVHVVALPLAFLKDEFAKVPDLACFVGQIDLRRSVDDAPFALDDFKVVRAAPAAVEPAIKPDGPIESTPGTAPTPVESPPVESPPVESPPVESPPEGSSARLHLTGEGLKADLKAGIASKMIVANQWGGPVFVLEETTYMIIPRVFQVLFRKRVYSINPKKDLGRYLDALAKLPCVRQIEGKLIRRILLRPEARPCWAIAFDTKGLFEETEALGRVGTWEGSQIREITEAEFKALLNSRHPLDPSVPAGGEDAGENLAL